MAEGQETEHDSDSYHHRSRPLDLGLRRLRCSASDLSNFLKTLPPDVAARWASNVLQWTRAHGYSQVPTAMSYGTHCGAGTLDFIDNDGSALNPVPDDGKMLAH